jgi:uncharacterized membrane protein
VANSSDELEALNLRLAALTQRVVQLEQLSSQSQISQDKPSAEPVHPEPTSPPPFPPRVEPTLETVKAPVAKTESRSPMLAARHSAPPFKLQNISADVRSNGSMEEKIGQYWLNRVGIVAILVGVSYFLKYAFENNWIGPAGRIAIGILAGIGLVLWSERFRKGGYRAFSYSLKAIGIGTLYLSFWGAYQVYHLISSPVAFVAMIIVTASTMALALSQNAEVLASFALAGGFATPLLLSTGENHEVILFSYACLLDMAILVTAIVKPWQRLLWGSFAGTIILYLAWSSAYYTKEQRADTVFFSAVFATLFAVTPLVLHRDDPGQTNRVPIILRVLPLLNATLFFLALYVMYESETATLTWYALVLAAAYLGIANAYKKLSHSQESNFVHLLHVAIAIAFITIAIPAKLQAHWITIGWLVESAVLLWVSVRTKTNFLRHLAAAALLLGIARLLFFDQMIAETLIFNARFASYLVAIAILAAIAFYGRRHATAPEIVFVDAAAVGANLLALIALTWEISDYFSQQMAVRADNPAFYYDISVTRGFTYSAIWLIYGAALMACGFWKRSPFARWQALVLIALTTFKVFAFDVSQLGGSYRIISFIALGSVLLAISFVYQRDLLHLSSRSPEKSEEDSR